jgi:hypothetical protein
MIEESGYLGEPPWSMSSTNSLIEVRLKWSGSGELIASTDLSGLSICRILEKPGPYFEILSPGSLKGRRFQGKKSAILPSRFTTFFSQDAQFTGPRCFLVNIASSSLPFPLFVSKFISISNNAFS